MNRRIRLLGAITAVATLAGLAAAPAAANAPGVVVFATQPATIVAGGTFLGANCGAAVCWVGGSGRYSFEARGGVAACAGIVLDGSIAGATLTACGTANVGACPQASDQLCSTGSFATIVGGTGEAMSGNGGPLAPTADLVPATGATSDIKAQGGATYKTGGYTIIFVAGVGILTATVDNAPAVGVVDIAAVPSAPNVSAGLAGGFGVFTPVFTVEAVVVATS